MRGGYARCAPRYHARLFLSVVALVKVGAQLFCSNLCARLHRSRAGAAVTAMHTDCYDDVPSARSKCTAHRPLHPQGTTCIRIADLPLACSRNPPALATNTTRVVEKSAHVCAGHNITESEHRS